MSKRILAAVLGIFLVIGGLAGCSAPADVVSQNISNDADNFKVDRRIVVVNLITDKYLLEVTGKCSITNDVTKKQFEITCKIGSDKYLKDYLVYTDGANVVSTIEQLVTTDVNDFRYKFNFYPENVIPTVVTK